MYVHVKGMCPLTNPYVESVQSSVCVNVFPNKRKTFVRMSLTSNNVSCVPFVFTSQMFTTSFSENFSIIFVV